MVDHWVKISLEGFPLQIVPGDVATPSILEGEWVLAPDGTITGLIWDRQTKEWIDGE